MFWKILSWSHVVLYLLAGYVFIDGAFGLDLPPREPSLLQVGLAISWFQLATMIRENRALAARVVSLRDAIDRSRR